MQYISQKPRHKVIITRQIASIRNKLDQQELIIVKLRGERSRILDGLARSNASLLESSQIEHIDLSIGARYKHIGRWRRLLINLCRELGEASS